MTNSQASPPVGDDLVEREDAISVAKLLEWIELAWPAGSGSDFNQGVVRGFEIIRAQLEQGHIQRHCALSPQPATRGVDVEALEQWKGQVYLDLNEQRNPGTDEFAKGFNGGLTTARDAIYAKLPSLFSTLFNVQGSPK